VIEIIPDHPLYPDPEPLAFCEWDKHGLYCYVTLLDDGKERDGVFGVVKRSRGIFIGTYTASLTTIEGVHTYPSTPSMITAVGFILEPYLPENVERIKVRET